MMTQNANASDIKRDSWILRLAPRPARPYMRLARMDRPIGTWLLLIPCLWGVALAFDSWPDVILIVLFAVGAMAMRGAGCTINDIVDRDIDAKVARTATRPIPSGEITVKQAYVFLIVQLLIGLAVLAQLNTFAALLAVSSIGLVFFYPFAKRFTNWPQLVLGLAINWGALVGWAAVTGNLDWPAVALYVGGVFWTLGYDTIYAYQDKEDDKKIGVKSLTFVLGDKPKAWLLSFYAVTAAMVLLSGYLADVHVWFFAGAAFCAIHLIWQVHTVDLTEPAQCSAKFLSNRDFGLALFTIIAVTTAVS